MEFYKMCMQVKFTILIGLFFLLCSSLEAQKRLQGLFEGSLTVGGLESSQKLKLEMFLRFDGQEISGRSYVHLAKGQVVEMELQGYLYSDFSVYLQEIRHIPANEEDQVKPPYFRKYQMQYSGNFEEVILTGFWQEETEVPLGKQRVIGKVRLRKINGSKA
jgi:hypothetical protein